MKYTDQNQEEENQGGGQRGRSKKNKGGNQWETNTEETGLGEQGEEGLGGEGGEMEGGEGKRKKGRKSRFEEQDFNQEKGGEAGDEGGRPGRPNKLEGIAKKVMTFVEEHTADMDKDTIAKYAAVGVLLLAGMRKSGFLGGLAVSVAAGVLTKLIVENASQMQEEWEGEEETEEEAVA